MGWLIALGLLFLIAVFPVGVKVRYDSNGFYLGLVLGFLRIKLFPMKRKSKKKKEKPKPETEARKPEEEPATSQPEEKPAPSQPEENPGQRGGSLTDFLPIARLALDFLNHFRRMLCVDHLQLKLILAGDDPCDLAVNYGRAWAALGNFLPMLERVVHIRKRDCEVECDFTAQQTLVIAQAEMTLRIWQAVTLMSVYGFGFIKELLILKKKRKGGGVS